MISGERPPGSAVVFRGCLESTPSNILPLVNIQKLWNINENHNFNEKTHYQWPFSIAMVVYQRVALYLASYVATNSDHTEGIQIYPDLI